MICKIMLSNLLIFNVAALGESCLQHNRVVFVLGTYSVVRRCGSINADVVQAFQAAVLFSGGRLEHNLLVPKVILRVVLSFGEIPTIDWPKRIHVDIWIA